MDTLVTVLSAILVFGILIFIHEFGHYIFARIFNVTITEFSIGMGPKLVWYDSKKTGIRYALSMIPFGGYVAMVGEDGESDDPNSFDKKPAWQRFIITVAGATVNIVAGLICIVILSCMVNIGGTTVAKFVDTGLGTTTEGTLLEGDTVIEVDGKRVRIADELSYEIMRRGNEPIDITVIRDGKEIVLPDVVFPTEESEGQVFGVMDFQVWASEKTFGSVLSYSMSKSWLIIRMVWESLFDLITGRYTIAAVSGPVGISGAIGDAAKLGFSSLLYITGLISINLGVMNLLPIPALDGGRLVCILFEMITRKRIPKNIEASVNGIGLLLLLGFSVFIMIKDIVGLF
ncbi:MAG: site-2 protease family protein [Clostridia bacterium]|nr:site-2 protease family protein [Clostridia bacterium]MBO5206257.1 site-2 protease family protein [Clostridia bacterium]MBP3583342.1 site-2 protease family protein [Clostridia bacterium]